MTGRKLAIGIFLSVAVVIVSASGAVLAQGADQGGQSASCQFSGQGCEDPPVPYVVGSGPGGGGTGPGGGSAPQPAAPQLQFAPPAGPALSVPAAPAAQPVLATPSFTG